VTISDTELEAGLRELRSHVDHLTPAPADLAGRTRERYRAQRRGRIAMATGALVAALVVVGVPAVGSTVLDGRGQTAAPTTGGTPGRLPSMAALPTRGSLSNDVAWLEAARLLPWSWTAAPGTTPEAPVDTRRVTFAGDVPGARVALVLGGIEEPAAAWFVGPVGASPEQMVLAAAPSDTIDQQPLALLDVPDPSLKSRTLVVVAWPGEKASLVTGRSVDAAGKISEQRRPVPMTEGAGAIMTGGPPAYPAQTQLWVDRTIPVRGSYNPTLTISARALAVGRPATEVADPRGLRGSVREDDLQATVTALTGYYGTPADELRPTLLAGSAIPADSPTSTVLVGVTFPSGATTVALGIRWATTDDPSGSMFQVAVKNEITPAGLALRDRVFAVPCSIPGGLALTVSGPSSATRVVVTGRDGTTIADTRLVSGAGAVRVSANPDRATLRFLDDEGAQLATAPITGPGD
jgi:hypothetical protein